LFVRSFSKMKESRNIDRQGVKKEMMLNKLLAIGIIVPLLVLIAPNVYARHLIYTERHNDGYSNGSDAAAGESTYNPTCDLYINRKGEL
jgi:hypothetical protein